MGHEKSRSLQARTSNNAALVPSTRWPQARCAVFLAVKQHSEQIILRFNAIGPSAGCIVRIHHAHASASLVLDQQQRDTVSLEVI